MRHEKLAWIIIQTDVKIESTLKIMASSEPLVQGEIKKQIRLIYLELKETIVSAAIHAPFNNKAAYPEGTYHALIHIHDTAA